MILTIDVPSAVAEKWNAFPQEEKERRARLIIEAIEAPRAVTWEELTGFTDAEEEDFAADPGKFATALSSLQEEAEDAGERL